jgi:hypothetical protein
MTIVTVGIDLAKNVFAVHGVDESGKPALVRPDVPRAKLLELIATLPACLIGMEACSGAGQGVQGQVPGGRARAGFAVACGLARCVGGELTGRSWGVSMEYRLHKLGQYLRGWTAYFGISQYYRPIPELDEWIRRRMRMCYWKQWRRARTKIRNLLALGVSLKSAIQHGVSSNSYWQMSRTQVINQALSNAERCGSNSAGALLDSAKKPRLWRGCGLQGWLKEQGLLSVKDLWCKAQGYTDQKRNTS